LGRRTPAEVWHSAPRSGPEKTAITATTRVHHGIVSGGRVSAGAYAISLGVAHNGQAVTTVITGKNAHLFIAGTLVRSLTLNPNQRSQPFLPTPPTMSYDPRHP
jgi:hypothetical protein